MDKDLEFLKDVDDRYLDVLVDVMINYDGGTSKIRAVKEECSKYGTSYKNYLDVIIDAYLNYGRDAFDIIGGSIKTSYRHLLSDVCSKLGVKFNLEMTIEENEQIVLKTALLKAVDDLDGDRLVDLIISTYAKPKKTLLKEWLLRIIIPTMDNAPILPLNNKLIYINPLTALIIDLYNNCKPELQVTLPCTLLIAVFRKTIRA